MTVPTPKTWAASEFVDATEANAEWRDTFNFLLAPPRAYAYHTAGTPLTDGAWTLISLGAELYDPYSPAAHDNATNNSRLVAAETGLYVIANQVRTTDLTATIFQYQVRKNSGGLDTGGTRVFLESLNGAGGGQVSEDGRTVDYPLNATDYVEMFVRVDTGANPNASLVAGADATFLSIRWASKQ